VVPLLGDLGFPDMRFAILSSLCYCALVRAQLSVVDQYVATESPIAKAGLLANIGPSGSKSAGAKVSYSLYYRSVHFPYDLLHQAGLVIASPSTTNPNYLFTWTRDSALVFKTIIDQYELCLTIYSKFLYFVTDLLAVKMVHFEPQSINILPRKLLYSRFRILVELYQQVVLVNLSLTSMGRPSRAHGEGG